MTSTTIEHSSRTSLSLIKLGIWIFFGVIFALTPCVDADEHSAAHSDSSVRHVLELNNGEKWSADSHTMDYATKMNMLMVQSKESQVEKTLATMQALGGALQKHLDELIRGCTMTGPSHEKLHLWLSEVAPNIAALKNAGTELQAKETYNQLKSQLKEFSAYFSLSD